MVEVVVLERLLVEVVLEQLHAAVDGRVGTVCLDLNGFYVAELANGLQLLLYPWLFLLESCTLDDG